MMRTTSNQQRLPFLDNTQLLEAADCLRILAHPQRLDMIQQLLAASTTVGELARTCHLSPAMASGHLRLMQRCGLLALKRKKRHVYYSIAEPCLRDLMTCLQHRFSQK